MPQKTSYKIIKEEAKHKTSTSLPAQVLLPETASTQHYVPYLIPPSVVPPVKQKNYQEKYAFTENGSVNSTVRFYI
jgi:hypothetical protein